MPKWMDETKKRIKELKEERFFENWLQKDCGKIIFYIYPGFNISDEWINQRIEIYNANAEKFRITTPKISFFVYPSIDIGEQLGIMPAISFIKEKEIHGHIKQSPGHELTHMLLGEINPSENLPANGLWSEGICVYLDGTKTDRKKHSLSLNFTSDILQTSWSEWRRYMPGDIYPLAGSIIQYCEEKFKWDAILKYLKELKDFGSNDEKISLDIFEISYPELQNNWRDWLKQ